MTQFSGDRDLVVQARDRLDEWTRQARTAAYDDLFAGDDPILDPGEIQLLDAVDSALERRGGDGLWGTDQYGIHSAGSGEAALGVVCVYHPQIKADTVLRGDDGMDDETELRLDDALWQYGERVAALIEDHLDSFLAEQRD